MQLNHYFQYVPLIDEGYAFKCIAPLLQIQQKKKINQFAQHQKLLNQRITINILRECVPKIGEN